MRTCLGREEALRSEMPHLLQHQTAPAGTGPKRQTLLKNSANSLEATAKPPSAQVSSQARGANETIQGAHPEEALRPEEEHVASGLLPEPFP